MERISTSGFIWDKKTRASSNGTTSALNSRSHWKKYLRVDTWCQVTVVSAVSKYSWPGSCSTSVSDKIYQASHAPLEPLHSPLDKGKPPVPSTHAHTCISLDSNGNYCLRCKVIMASICKFSYDLYFYLCFYQFLSCVTYQIVSSGLINILDFSQSSKYHTSVDKILSKSL